MASPALPVISAMLARTWRKTFRRPVSLTFSLFQPLMWMLFFGFLMQRFPLGDVAQPVSYTSFLLPGICAMTVLFGASQSGVGLIRDMQTGLLQRMLATPAPRWALHAGRIIADSLRLLLQAVVVAALGILLGAKVHVQPAALLQGVLILFLFAVALASLSHAVALVARKQETMATFVHVINMPLFFTSTALVPQKQMPEWLATIAAWNPLTLAVEGLRAPLLYQATPQWQSQLLPMLVLAITLSWLAHYLLGRAVTVSVWKTR